MTLYETLRLDPRPDLFDTELWSKWLRRIPRHIHTGMDLCALSALHSLRSIGTIIRWDMNYGYKLTPLYDFGNWESKELYEEMKQYLMPYAAHFRKWFELIQQEDV
jgi:patatin-like phospholipase/acyl hydrolase